MRYSILQTRSGYYVETAHSNGDVFTDGPYSLQVARYLAPGASVQPCSPWTDSAQRAEANAADAEAGA